MLSRVATAALLGLGSLVHAVAVPQNSVGTPSTSARTPGATSGPGTYTPSEADLDSGCANIGRVAATFVQTADSDGAVEFQISPKIAYDCLASIPLEIQPAMDFLFELSKFVQFQSTISYLARPPANSGQDPMDLIGGLEDLSNSVQSGSITSWNDLETRVDRLLSGCHEGHLYVAWVLPSLINFRAPFSLMDLSTDGKTASKVYVADDITQQNANSRFRASAITELDGEDIITAIERLTYYESSQSPDTRWNAAFLSQNPPKRGSFFQRTRYPGSNTFRLRFENGTTTEYAYQAFALHQAGSNIWTVLESGQDIWDRLINVDPNADPNSGAGKLKARALEESKKRRAQNDQVDNILQRLQKRQASNSPPPRDRLVRYNASFPDTPRVRPYIQDINRVVGGYFMDDYTNDGSRTAVIDITGFAPDDQNANFAPHAVQAAVELFLEEAKRRNMERLIIDVRGNGGGYVNMGYDLYKQLFPSGAAYSGTRLRNHPASLRIAQAFTQLVNQDVIRELTTAIGGGMGENLTRAQVNAYQVASYASLSNLNQFLNLDEDGREFTSFGDFFGPADIYDDQFTNIFTYNLNSLIAVGDLSYDVSGYGDRAAAYRDREPPFAPENVVLVTDGVCASTCGIFAEFLRNEQKIRTVVIGGRPNGEASAAVGGTRGTQVIQHTAHMLNFVQIVENNFQPRDAAESAEWEQFFPRPFRLNIAEAAVNWKDNIRRADPTQTPLQFYLEAADCRLYYTPESLVLSHRLWGQIDDLAWGDDVDCAWGSLKNATVVLGDSRGVPVSIGATGGDTGVNSGFGDVPQLTGDKIIDTGKIIWYGVRNSLGASGGRRPY